MDGYLPSTNPFYLAPEDYANWDLWDTSDIVDGDQLQRNWAVIFSHVNGCIDGTDFEDDSAQFDEGTSLVDYEAGNSQWSTVGQRHSHDGVDSALLVDECLTATLLGTPADPGGSYGFIRHGSMTSLGVLMSVWAGYDQPSPQAGILYAQQVAVPYNHERWLFNHIQRSGVAIGGRCAFLVCPVLTGFESWSADEKCSTSCMGISLGLDGQDVTSVSASQQDALTVRPPSSWAYGVVALAVLAAS